MGRQRRSTLQLTQRVLKLSTPSQQTLLKKMSLLSNSRRQNTISDTVRIKFLHANRGRKYRCLIFSFVPPSLRRTHIARTLCEMSSVVSSAAMLVLCTLYCQSTIINNIRTNSIFDNSTLRIRIRDVPAPMPAPIPSPPACAPGHKVTRTGRVIQAPQTLDLQAYHFRDIDIVILQVYSLAPLMGEVV